MEIIPGYLYKYKSFDVKNYWKDILLKKRLCMARPNEFNDPFEGQLFPFGTATCGGSIHLQAGQPNKDVKQFLDDYRVVCLSSNIHNKAMWAYYADNYHGFAIRFTTFKAGLYDDEQNNFSSAKRVIYKSLKLRTPETLMRQGFIGFSDIRRHHIMHTVSGTFPINRAVLP